MGWKQTELLVSSFEDAYSRLSNRVETANDRNEPLAWKNYRKWYIKLIHESKQGLRKLKRNLTSHSDLLQILENLEASLKIVFDINSDTKLKWQSIGASRQIWNQFKSELTRKVRQEYDPFPNRTFEIAPRLCFVLMPFDKAFNPVYKAIKPAVTRVGLRAKRADEIFKPTPIVQDIWEHINKANLIIADVTDRNPNVFYEVGLSHALPKRVIILTQRKEDVPFDIQHIRWIRYENNVSGRKELSKKLNRMIKSMVT